MKNLKKRKFILIGLVLCFLVSVFIGMFSATTANISAFADTETDYSDLSFSLINGNEEYKVTALNKQLTQANIPAYYNGKPVTEIGDSAFSRCTKLETVTIPHTVTKVGSNAFAACSNLFNISGMSSVQSIGNNAFANCTKLDKFILPATIENLGSSILRNNPNEIYSRLSENRMNSLNATWNSNLGSSGEIIYGNHLVYLDVLDENNEFIGYQIKEYQNIYADSDIDSNFVVYSSYNNSPVLNIQQEAFAFCTFKSFTIKHNEEENFTHSINICNQAFSFMAADYISIEVDITLYDTDSDWPNSSYGIFADAEVETITLPDSLTAIPESTFIGCYALKQILNTNSEYGANHLSNNITLIDDSAFEGCTALETLYIPSSVTRINNSAFNNWGVNGNQTIYFDLYAPGEWDDNWTGTLYNNNVSLEFKEMLISLEKNGGTGGDNYLRVQYGKVMPQAIAPERSHYTFKGYFTEQGGNGDCFYSENMESEAVWRGSEPVILYAFWEAHTFNVSLNSQGGSGGTEQVVATYEQAMPAENVSMPARTGYIFDGYYTQPNGSGTQYYTQQMTSAKNWNIPEDTTLYANWTNKEYTVIFDKNGGTGGTSFVKVTYDLPLPDITIPSKVGFDFLGYYSEAGVQYYNEDVDPMFELWNFDSEEEIIILTASWQEQRYKITLNNQDGSENVIRTVTIGMVMPEASIPARLGYTFNGYFIDPECTGTRYYNSDMSSARDWDIPADTTLYAKWEVIVYSISYVGVTQANNPNPKTYTIEDEIVFADPIDCDYLIGCDWAPSGITVGLTGNITVTATYRERHLWENKEVVDGKESYLIYTPQQFLEINEMNLNYKNPKYFYLMSDLDFSEYLNPHIHNRFEGKFYGGNHTIRGVNLRECDDPEHGEYGLFSYVFYESLVCDLNLYATLYLEGDNVHSICAGLLCGLTFGTIQNCNVYGESNLSDDFEHDIYIGSGSVWVGGIVGSCVKDGKIINCKNYASIYSCGKIGGIVGDYDGIQFTDNVNNGDIYVICHINGLSLGVGGLIGTMRGNTIKDCINNGDIYLHMEMVDSPMVGKLVGYAFSYASLINCEGNGMIDVGNLPEDCRQNIGGDVGYIN